MPAALHAEARLPPAHGVPGERVPGRPAAGALGGGVVLHRGGDLVKRPHTPFYVTPSLTELADARSNTPLYCGSTMERSGMGLQLLGFKLTASCRTLVVLLG